MNQQFQEPLYSKGDEAYYRLRSARAKRRAVIEARDKQLLRLHRRQEALVSERREQPLVELAPPIMRGWKRFFVLRDDVARSRDAYFYERILEHINTIQFAHTRHFVKKKRKFGRKIYLPRNQYLLALNAWRWQQAAFSEREAALFDLQLIYENARSRYPEPRYVFREPWRYQLRVVPNMITHVRYRNSLLESEEALIDQYFRRNELYGRLSKLLQGNSYHYKSLPDDKVYVPRYPFRSIPLHRVLADA